MMILMVMMTMMTMLQGQKAMLAYTMLTQYKQEFGGKRLSTNHGKFPTSSKLEPADVRNWKSNQQQVLENYKLHPANFASCKLLQDVDKVDHDNKLIHAPKNVINPKPTYLIWIIFMLIISSCFGHSPLLVPSCTFSGRKG